jgi:Holliday junction resolvase-like predicted endonuclease
MVGEEKLRRMYRAAEAWLVRNPTAADLDCRFEVVAVRPGQLERVAI